MNRCLAEIIKAFEGFRDDVTYIKRTGEKTLIRQRHIAREFVLPISFPRPVIISASQFFAIREELEKIRVSIVEGIRVSLDLIDYGFSVKYYNQSGMFLKKFTIKFITTKNRFIVSYLRKRYRLIDNV